MKQKININKKIIINFSDYCEKKKNNKYFNQEENEKNDNIENKNDSTISNIFKICEKILKKKINK